ncbi:MAG: VOC family protein [Chloroflexota bacterium]
MPTYSTNIGHVHLKVRDLKESITFYQTFFSLNFIEQVDNDYAFLSGSAFHHEVALQQIGANAPDSHPYGVGLYHVAFEVPSQTDFAQAYQTLKAAEVPVVAVDHRISWALYFKDPSGNGLELYWDTRQTDHGEPLWQGKSLPLSEEEILSPFVV